MGEGRIVAKVWHKKHQVVLELVREEIKYEIREDYSGAQNFVNCSKILALVLSESHGWYITL